MALSREFIEEFNFSIRAGSNIAKVYFEHHGEQRELLAYTLSIVDDSAPVLTEHSEIRRATMAEIENLDFVDSDRLLIPELKRWVLNV